jgi:predicted RNA polymerase sigma factor
MPPEPEVHGLVALMEIQASTAPPLWGWPSAPRPASSSPTRSPPRGRADGYHLLPSVRGDLLAKLGRGDEARAEFERGRR